MTDVVTDTLAKWRRSRFEWGKTDCIMSVADYVSLTTGVDHAAPYRGTYDDEPGAMAIVAASGGEDALLDTMALARVEKPVRGDAVAADLANGQRIAGICTGGAVAFRTVDRGVIELGMKFLHNITAWRVPCHQ